MIHYTTTDDKNNKSTTIVLENKPTTKKGVTESKLKLIKGVIENKLFDGFIVVRPFLIDGMGLGNQMFNWASTYSIITRILNIMPANCRIELVVPSDSRIYKVFGRQVSKLYKIYFSAY